jgi:hypothetical protein
VKFYKFANNQRINENFIKENLITISEIEESYGCADFYFTLSFKSIGEFQEINIRFNDEILAREQLKEFLYYLDTMI